MQALTPRLTDVFCNISYSEEEAAGIQFRISAAAFSLQAWTNMRHSGMRPPCGKPAVTEHNVYDSRGTDSNQKVFPLQ